MSTFDYQSALDDKNHLIEQLRIMLATKDVLIAQQDILIDKLYAELAEINRQMEW